jgi:hypothetical protein
VFSLLKSIARSFGVDTRAAYQRLSAWSIASAVKEQGLQPLSLELAKIIPDLRDQYTSGFDETEYRRYWEAKMRGLHAWQIQCVLDSLEHLTEDGVVIADIGDSSGNHGIYLKGLDNAGRISDVISVNLDPVAVEKVTSKGGKAILSRAEDLDLQNIKSDLFLSFEMIEHLTDPVRFLHSLALEGHSEYLLMTVPYRRQSRFGGDYMRLDSDSQPEEMSAEEVHVFEFSPEDWLLLAKFAGFTPVFTRRYLQYPRRSPLRLLAPLWRAVDFEGFFGVLLKRDLSLAKKYTGW